MKFGIRELIFLLVLLSMPISSYWFVFRPQNQEIAEAKKEIEHKELMLDQLAAATEQSEDLERANEDIVTGIAQIESRLPAAKEVDVILHQVSEIATEERLQLAMVKAEKSVPAAGYMEQPLSMDVNGNFNNFYSFLLRLEQLDRITRILDLKIKKVDKQDGAMRAEFTLSIYFQPDSKSGASS